LSYNIGDMAQKFLPSCRERLDYDVEGLACLNKPPLLYMTAVKPRS
jgi:hypothetical protein